MQKWRHLDGLDSEHKAKESMEFEQTKQTDLEIE